MQSQMRGFFAALRMTEEEAAAKANAEVGWGTGKGKCGSWLANGGGREADFSTALLTMRL